MMAGKYGFGIIGTGAIAKVHAAAVKSLENAELVACYDLNGERSDAFAAQHGIKSYHEIEAFLKDTDVWVCSVCGFIYTGDTPPELCPVCKVPDWKFEKMEGRVFG